MPAADHVVLGATGGAGRAVVNELLRRDKPVRAVSRTGSTDFSEEVTGVAADCSDLDAAKQACENAAVVYNCMNVPYAEWEDVLPILTENSIAAAAHAGAPLVVTDNLYAYGPTDGPMTEETARTPAGPKCDLRLTMENRLLDAHAKGHIPVAIGRASDYYGAHANSAARELVFETALNGTTAAWLGSLDAPHTMSYLPDFARGLVTLGMHETAYGEIWHLPSNDPITGRHFIQRVYEEAGEEPSMRTYGYWPLTLAGLFDAQIWESREVLYQFRERFVMDFSKFEAAFGRTVTPYDTAIRETLEWHQQKSN